MAPITRLVALARRQDRVLSLADLHSLGLSDEAVKHLVRSQRIWRVHRGVYALDGPLAPRGVARAAVVRSGPRAAADRLTAAFLSGHVDRPPSKPQVVTARRTGATGPPEIDLHRSSTLTRGDIDWSRGFPVTAPARTIIDCARIVPPGRLSCSSAAPSTAASTSPSSTGPASLSSSAASSTATSSAPA